MCPQVSTQFFLPLQHGFPDAGDSSVYPTSPSSNKPSLQLETGQQILWDTIIPPQLKTSRACNLILANRLRDSVIPPNSSKPSLQLKLALIVGYQNMHEIIIENLFLLPAVRLGAFVKVSAIKFCRYQVIQERMVRC